MLYHVDFHIEYPASMSQKDFFSIWAREAEGALGAKKAGVVIDMEMCRLSACGGGRQRG